MPGSKTIKSHINYFIIIWIDGYVCGDTGVCEPNACLTVTCPPDQVCDMGQCVSATPIPPEGVESGLAPTLVLLDDALTLDLAVILAHLVRPVSTPASSLLGC